MGAWVLGGLIAALALLSQGAPPSSSVPTVPARQAAGTAFPRPEAFRDAARWLDAREGVAGLAAIDAAGRLRVAGERGTFVSASVPKAMMLVAALRAAGDRSLSPAERDRLAAMIRRSSNDAADAVYATVGDAGLLAVAQLAGMRELSVHGYWASVQLAATDLARLFIRIDRLVPRRHRAFARRVLAARIPRQRWGFAGPARRQGFAVFLKGGWRSTDSGRLLHEGALLERGGARVALAVLSDGSPSHEYATATLKGVAKRVLAPAIDRRLLEAGLFDLQFSAPDLLLDQRYAGARNLTGHRLPGYCRRWGLMLSAPALSLAAVQTDLRRRGLGLLVYDAYRPARATRALVRWARRTGRGDLVGTYIATRSNHNRGAAVDLTLVRRGGRHLPMGTRYDSLSPRSHTGAVGGRAGRNRAILVAAMERRGFRNYEREWWHFDYPSADGPYLDVPLGCRGAG